MYQQLINLELKTDFNGAIRGFGKASFGNLQNKVQIPLIEDSYPGFMCNLCRNILSINIFFSVQHQQGEVQMVAPIVAPLVNLMSVQPSESQEEADEQEGRSDSESSDGNESENEGREEESSEEQEDNDADQEETLSEGTPERSPRNDPQSTRISETPHTEASNNTHAIPDTLESDLVPIPVESTSGSNTYTCDTCNRSYKTRFARYHHYKKRECSRPVERKRPPYLCEVCNKILTTRRGYLLHMKNELQHTKITQKLECPECFKVFKTKVGLRSHRFLHLNDDERPYQCQICKRGFASKLGFEIHELVHTKVKKHPCIICEESFDVKEKLRKHMVTHAEEFGEELHNCNCPDGRILSEIVEEQSDTDQEEIENNG